MKVHPVSERQHHITTLISVTDVPYDPFHRSFEGLQVKFSGLGVITWISNLLVAPTVKVFTPIIRKVFEIRIRDIIKQKLPALLQNIDLNAS